MMQFFRKHQKIFFIVITFVIVISFCFFGTYSAFAPDQKVADRILGKAVDGSKLSQRHVDAFVRFLAVGQEQNPFSSHPKPAALLNDGVVLKDFLQSGLAEMLADKYFELVKPDLQQRLEKASRYRPYQHPQAPFLSAQTTWQRFAPQLSQQLGQIKTQQADKKGFHALSDLYVAQARFPAEMLKRFLVYQQNQYGVQPDRDLEREDLSLFGFQNLEDWFGAHFLEVTAQFVINASKIAEQRGHAVSKEEARKGLMLNVAQGIQGIEGADVRSAYQMSLQSLGLDDTTAVEIWRQVMLFRSLTETLDQTLALDELSQKHFQTFATQAADVELFQLPEELRLKSFRDMLKLQVYLDAVSPVSYKSKGYCFQLPKLFLTSEEMEKQCPELVERRFELEVAEVSSETLSQQISLKETWEWELQEQHFPKLKAEFPALAKYKGETRDERFAALEKMDDELRLRIDQFARDQIVSTRPELIDQALAKAPLERKIVTIHPDGSSNVFKGLTDPQSFIALLTTSSPRLAKISFDGKHHYCVHVTRTSQAYEVLTFAQALREGVLDRLLDRRLEETYSEAKRKDPKSYQNPDGSWKPLQEVKDKVGAYAYAPLLKALDEQIKSSGKEEKAAWETYAAYRLYAHMKDAKEHLAIDAEDPSWVRSAKHETSLATQWQLTKSSQQMKRSDSAPGVANELFSLSKGSWSSVHAQASGNLAFFRLIGESTVAEVEEKGETLHPLSQDAQRQLMAQLIEEIQQKKGIHVE